MSKIYPAEQLQYVSIEEGFMQKARQTVVVSVWGARSNATLGIVGLNVQYCVHNVVHFPFTFVGEGMFYVDFISSLNI